MIHDIMYTPGIKIINELPFEILLPLWPSKIPDFGDSVIASLALQYKGSIVATFDKPFFSLLKKLGILTIDL